MKSLYLKLYGLFRNIIVPPNNYSEANFRHDGGNRQGPTQSLSNVSVHESPGELGPQGVQRAGLRFRIPASFRWHAVVQGSPRKGRWCGLLFIVPRFVVLLLRICSSLLPSPAGMTVLLSPTFLLNGACGKCPVTKPAPW